MGFPAVEANKHRVVTGSVGTYAILSQLGSSAEFWMVRTHCHSRGAINAAVANPPTAPPLFLLVLVLVVVSCCSTRPVILGFAAVDRVHHRARGLQHQLFRPARVPGRGRAMSGSFICRHPPPFPLPCSCPRAPVRGAALYDIRWRLLPNVARNVPGLKRRGCQQNNTLPAIHA